MKKVLYCVLVAGSLLAMSRCGRSAVIEYRLDSAEACEVRVDYRDGDGEIIQGVIAASPWSLSITQLHCDLPTLAFIRVDNLGSVDVSVRILDTGKTIAAAVAKWDDGAVECCAFIGK